jgi:ubiquitin C-terminal hydrolase
MSALPAQPTQQIRGVCGLINLGNTCYLNSSIQIVRSIPEWAAFCAEAPTPANAESKEARLLKSYADLTRGMWAQTKMMTCRPALFLKDLRAAVHDTIYDQFAAPIPNDGHEFLQYMLDQFHEALKMPGPIAEEAAHDAVKAWCAIWHRDYSPLVNMVFGLDQVQCICSSCGHISTRYETFNMLKVSLSDDRSKSFRDLFEAERAPCEIEDYACDKCAPVRRPAKIVRRLWKLPRNIMMVFRRFNENRTKNNAAIPNCTEVNFKEFFAAESPDESTNWKYEPIATLDHFGNHMGGHYSAQTYNCVMKKWYLYDDTTVNEIPTPHFGSSTYIVLLRRSEPSSNNS